MKGNLVCVKLNIAENAEDAARMNVTWTPTLLIVDANERVHYRLEGAFLPPDEFLPEIEVALAKAYFNAGKYDEAIRRFESVNREHPMSMAAPEALYWRGVAFYRKGNKDEFLNSWTKLYRHYTDSPRAASVAFLDIKTR